MKLKGKKRHSNLKNSFEFKYLLVSIYWTNIRNSYSHKLKKEEKNVNQAILSNDESYDLPKAGMFKNIEKKRWKILKDLF
jgi:hypothetical protein